MSTITITGASDDLIEIGGDIREEFNWYVESSEDEKINLNILESLLEKVEQNQQILFAYE